MQNNNVICFQKSAWRRLLMPSQVHFLPEVFAAKYNSDKNLLFYLLYNKPGTLKQQNKK